MSRTLAIASSLLLAAPAVLGDASSYAQNAGAANDRLLANDWFSTNGNGLWQNPGASAPYWWNSANMLTAACNTMALLTDQKSAHGGIVAQVYATNYHTPYKKRSELRHVIESTLHRRESANFVNGFNDDSAWWGLGWIRARDVMGNIEYLNTAIDVWNYINAHRSTDCPGGVLWNPGDSSSTAVNAISNSLFMTLSASIANRVGDNDKQQYIDAAKNTWTWFQGTGMINSDNLVNDGVTVPGCTNDGHPTYTYNSGSLIAALVELYRATQDSSLLDKASDLATAAIKPNGAFANADSVLTEGCVAANSCGGDGDQFKGVLLRGIQELYMERPTDALKAFVLANAQSIWNNDFQQQAAGTTLGVDWRGPFTDGTAETQSSALDCLNAAVLVSGQATGKSF